MGHKKVHSYDVTGYKSRVKKVIIEIFEKLPPGQGLLIDFLKLKIAHKMGGQVQTELLGESKLSEFITKEMHEQFGVNLYPNRYQGPCFSNECTYIVYPKTGGYFPPGMGLWGYSHPGIYMGEYSSSLAVHTPKTSDKTYNNIDYILNKNPSLNQTSRKGYNSPPGVNNSFNKMANYTPSNNLRICSMSHLSDIPQNEQHEAFSMLSYGLNNDLNLMETKQKNLEEEDVSPLHTPKPRVCQPQVKEKSEKEEKGFSYKVFDSDSIQVMGEDSSSESGEDKHFLSCKSEEEEEGDPGFLFEYQGLNVKSKLKIRKKQIRLSKSSRKNGKLRVKQTKMLNYLGI
jgi:hypothetical protein